MPVAFSKSTDEPTFKLLYIYSIVGEFYASAPKVGGPDRPAQCRPRDTSPSAHPRALTVSSSLFPGGSQQTQPPNHHDVPKARKCDHQSSRSSLSIWFEGEQERTQGQRAVECSANEHWRRCVGVCCCRNHSRHGPHQATKGNRYAVARSPVSRWQHLGREAIKDRIVDLQGEGDDAAVCDILSLRSDLRVGEEEGH